MMDRYQEENRGIQIIELENSFQMCTKKEYYQYLINIALHPQKPALSDVMLETLSIIAYKQPVTKAEIEKILPVVFSSTPMALAIRGSSTEPPIAKSIASIAASVSLIFTQSSSFLLLHIDLCILWFIFRKFCKILPCIRVCLYFNRDIIKQPVLLHMDMSHFHQFQYG